MPKRTHDGIKKRCTCAKRQWPKCAHPWHFSFHHGGVEHRYSLDAIARARSVPPPTMKGDAIVWRDRLRGEIRLGTFVDPDAPPPAPVADTRLTFGDVCDEYEKAHIKAPTRREGARKAMTWNLALIRRTEVPAGQGATIRLEQKPIDAITRADVEAFRTARRARLADAKATLERVAQIEARAAEMVDKRDRRALRCDALALRRTAKARPGIKGGEVGTNRLLARLRHVFSWAIKSGYIEHTPFKRAGEVVVELATRAETARTRQVLDVGEEERLLTHAGSHLRALIVAALSTGCRLGELLSLQWGQIRYDDEGKQARWILLSADRTKTNEARTIPVGAAPSSRARYASARAGRQGPRGRQVRVRQRSRRADRGDQDSVACDLPAGRNSRPALSRSPARMNSDRGFSNPGRHSTMCATFSATRTSRPRAAISRARPCGSNEHS